MADAWANAAVCFAVTALAAAVPDHRQKGPMHPTARSPEALWVRELVPALHANPAAAAACLKLQASLTGEEAVGSVQLHCTLALIRTP